MADQITLEGWPNKTGVTVQKVRTSNRMKTTDVYHFDQDEARKLLTLLRQWNDPNPTPADRYEVYTRYSDHLASFGDEDDAKDYADKRMGRFVIDTKRDKGYIIYRSEQDG